MPQRRRGRPRSHREKIDKGTRELQQKRQTLLGKGLAHNASLVESLLGVLCARHLISRPLYEVGCFFGELGYRYIPCLGYAFRKRAHVLSLKFGPCGEDQESPLSDFQEEKRTKAWRNALAALQQAGPAPYQMVLKVVFYDHDLYAHSLPASLMGELTALRKGLEHLDKYFKGELRDRRDKTHDPAPNPLRSTRSPQLLKEHPLLPLPSHLAQAHHAP